MTSQQIAWLAEISASNARVEALKVANVEYALAHDGRVCHPDSDFMHEANFLVEIANAAREEMNR